MEPVTRDRAAPLHGVRANGVDLGVESFGREDDPLVLLAGGTTMLSWPDRRRATTCAISPRTRPRWSPRSVRPQLISAAQAWVGWSPRSPRSNTRWRSRR
ncbi:hypothetical protein [Saccharopolyspora griseoalba]|uniref:Uncharacterized protein n=1 Tax=Saccharopolyspora griseoalba TaxID=1431848 RepID=A0ABW2LF37_9PSEU